MHCFLKHMHCYIKERLQCVRHCRLRIQHVFINKITPRTIILKLQVTISKSLCPFSEVNKNKLQMATGNLHIDSLRVLQDFMAGQVHVLRVKRESLALKGSILVSSFQKANLLKLLPSTCSQLKIKHKQDFVLILFDFFSYFIGVINIKKLFQYIILVFKKSYVVYKFYRCIFC